MQIHVTQQGIDLGTRVTVAKATNGIRLTSQETPPRNTAVITLYLVMGSQFDSPRLSGLRHFYEHVLLELSGVLEDWQKETARMLDRMGGFTGATDRTVIEIQLQCPTEDWYETLATLSELLLNFEATEEVVERHRSIIAQEMADDEDDLITRNQMRFEQVLYRREGRFRADAYGRKAHLELVTAKKLNRLHYEEVLFGRRMLIDVTGAIPYRDVRSAVLHLFREVPAGRNAKPKKKIHVSRGILVDPVRHVQKTFLMVGFPVPGGRYLSHFRARMLSVLIGELWSAGMWEYVRGELNSYWFEGTTTDEGAVAYVAAQAAVTRDSVNVFLTEFLEQWERLSTNLLTDATMETLKGNACSQLLIATDDAVTRSERALSMLVHRGHVVPFSAELARIRQFSRKGLRATVQAHCRPERLVASLVGNTFNVRFNQHVRSCVGGNIRRLKPGHQLT